MLKYPICLLICIVLGLVNRIMIVNEDGVSINNENKYIYY